MQKNKTDGKQFEAFNYSGTTAITAATMLGTVGALTILVMPGLLGVMVDAFGLNDNQLGLVASVEIFTMAIATGVATLGISRINWRQMACVALIVLAIGNITSILAQSISGLLWSRGVAGIGEGIAVAVSFSALGISRNPDRSFGIYLVFALIFSAILLYALPFIVQLGGHFLVFSFLAALCLINMLFLPWLSPQAQRRAMDVGQGHFHVPYKLVGIGLAMVTFFFIGQGAVWSYLERMGAARDIDAQSVSAALSLSALAGIVGAGIAMLMGNRIGRSVPITFGVMVQVISMLILTTEFDKEGFIIAVMIFNFSWNLCQPYFSGVMSELDPEGRAVALMGSLQTIGVSVGPLIAAVIIRPGEYDSISYLGIGTVLIALVMSYLLHSLWKSRRTAVLSFAKPNVGSDVNAFD